MSAPVNVSLANSISSLPEAQRSKLLESFEDHEIEEILNDWLFWARPNQIAPDGDWHNWLVLAGRGFGKTRTGAEWVRSLIKAGYTRVGMIAPTAADARDIMVEGESGLLSVCWEDDCTDTGRHLGKPLYESSKRRVRWKNGAIATLFSAEEPERLRGPQHEALWCDELCAWRYMQETWDMAMFGLRLGPNPRTLISTTPKPSKLLREIVADENTVVTGGSTFENSGNLSPQFFVKVKSKYEGTRLGRQELEAQILDDNPYALWKRENIDDNRVRSIEELVRVVVAVDPPVSTTEESDECGIVGAGRNRDRSRMYVLDDFSCQGLSPQGWAERAVRLYHQLEADAIVAEVNQGGDLVEAVIRQVDPNVPVINVHATRGKVVRAEPIAALYEQNRVKHVGNFGELEDQMCDFTSDFDRKKMGYSPDRVDALVWAGTELMIEAEEQAAVVLRSKHR